MIDLILTLAALAAAQAQPDADAATRIEGALNRAKAELATAYGASCMVERNSELANTIRRRYQESSERLDVAIDAAELRIGRKMQITLWVSECWSLYDEQRFSAALRSADEAVDQARIIMLDVKAN